MLHLTLLLSLLLCTNIRLSGALECGGTLSCGASESCCDDLVSGYRCYDPSSYTCTENDAKQTVLCSSGDAACGSTCYDPTQYICEQGELLCSYQQGQTIKPCGGACYDPTTYGCCGDQLFLANSLPSNCAALNNATYQGPLFCSPFIQTICNLGWCCDNECYDATVHTCFDNQICPLGYEVCNLTCFDPNKQECCNNELFAYGTSVCSEPSATCCNCACTSEIETNYTVASTSQCSVDFLHPQFPETFGCTGDIACRISGHSACSGPESNVYESGYNTTQVGAGSTSYEPVPANFAGEVCCWCSSVSQEDATSAGVPNLSYCNKAYLAEMDYFTAPDAVCQVWSPFKFFTQGLDCGIPNG